jgi:RimJ/RimL family protein N-acetyltransferase
VAEAGSFEELQTERLRMRRWTTADRAPFAAMNADPEVMRFFPGLLDRAASDAFADRVERSFDEHGYGLWALEPLDGGGFIGFTGLARMPDDVPGAGGLEIGWRLAADAWGRGYATEAARAAVDVAWWALGVDEVWSMTAVVNVPSQRVMQRLGMVRWAEFEHPRVPEGHPVRPHVLYHLARPSAFR